MPCELVHDWPCGSSEGQGFTCQACGAFVSDEVVRSYAPASHVYVLDEIVPTKVLDDIAAVQQRLGGITCFST